MSLQSTVQVNSFLGCCCPLFCSNASSGVFLIVFRNNQTELECETKADCSVQGDTKKVCNTALDMSSV